MLGCPAGTVKSRCFRGRAKLAKRLAFLRNQDHADPVTPTEGGETPHG
jgi:RNA polymerase sigma-70 factor (ECF subfamily)